MTRQCMYKHCLKVYGEKCPRCGEEATRMPTGLFICLSQKCRENKLAPREPFPAGTGGITTGVCPDCRPKQQVESQVFHAKKAEQRRSAR